MVDHVELILFGLLLGVAALTRFGEGGLIALDAQGRLAMPFNSEAMSRGWRVGAEAPATAILRGGP